MNKEAESETERIEKLKESISLKISPWFAFINHRDSLLITPWLTKVTEWNCHHHRRGNDSKSKLNYQHLHIYIYQYVFSFSTMRITFIPDSKASQLAQTS